MDNTATLESYHKWVVEVLQCNLNQETKSIVQFDLFLCYSGGAVSRFNLMDLHFPEFLIRKNWMLLLNKDWIFGSVQNELSQFVVQGIDKNHVPRWKDFRRKKTRKERKRTGSRNRIQTFPYQFHALKMNEKINNIKPLYWINELFLMKSKIKFR